MKILWLEQMTKEGSVSAAARDAIYADCTDLMKVATGGKIAPKTIGAFLEENPALVGTAAIGAVGLMFGAARSAVSSILSTKEFRKDLDATRSSMMSHPDFSPHKEKAQARFEELVKFAPSVARNKDLALRIMKEKIHSGFTSEDIQRLTHIQSAYTPDMKAQMNLSQRAKTASDRRMGEALASTLVMCKEAGIRSRTMGRALENTIALSAIPFFGALGTGAVNHYIEKNNKKKMEAALTHSFETAIRNSHPENDGLAENKEKARQLFQILAHFSPHVAMQPEAAKSFMSKMIQYDNTGRGAVQVEDIKNLSEIQSNHSRGSRGSSFFEGMAAGAKAMGLDSALKSGVQGLSRPMNAELSMMATDDLDLSSNDLRGHGGK